MMSSILLRFVVAAITSSASVATSVSTSDAFAINITEPLHRYAGPEGCSDSYDLVRTELLIFDVHVTCMQQVDFSVIILNRTSNILVPGCRKFCQQAEHSTCAVRCNVRDLPDTSVYVIKASAKDLTADKSWTLCINAKDTAQVSFVGKQPTDVWSADGSIQLRFEAAGYPRPISYELSCDGRPTSVSPSGGFNFAGLPNGTTQCAALAYTNRRLLRTEPLNVLIHVSPEKTFTGNTPGTDSSRASSSPATSATTTKCMSTATSALQIFSAAASTSRSMDAAASTSGINSSDNSAFSMITFLPTPLSIPQAMPQPHNGGVTDDAALQAVIVVASAMALLTTLVSFALYKRCAKKESHCRTDGGTLPAVAVSQLSSSTGLSAACNVSAAPVINNNSLSAACNVSAAPIINNNSTSVTIINNTFAFQGEHIDQSESIGIDEPCSRHYDGREHGKGADEEDIAYKDSLYPAELLQSFGSLASTPQPSRPPPAQLPNEPARADCSETSPKHYVDMGNGYGNGQTSDSPHASIGRLSKLLISSALAASLKDNSENEVTKSAERAVNNRYDLTWVRATDRVQQSPALPLHLSLSEGVEPDADGRRKAPKYPVLGATRGWDGSAFC